MQLQLVGRVGGATGIGNTGAHVSAGLELSSTCALELHQNLGLPRRWRRRRSYLSELATGPLLASCWLSGAGVVAVDLRQEMRLVAGFSCHTHGCYFRLDGRKIEMSR